MVLSDSNDRGKVSRVGQHKAKVEATFQNNGVLHVDVLKKVLWGHELNGRAKAPTYSWYAVPKHSSAYRGGQVRRMHKVYTSYRGA